MPWSTVTAGGTATTWASASGSTFTWTAGASRNSFAWVPYAVQTDLWEGVDFVPKASVEAPLKLDSTRPAVVWNVSALTASNASAEGKP